MSNTPYSNFVLANEIEDQYNSHLDLVRFCTVDDSLVGVAGMKKTVHTYTATNGTQKLTVGNGNTQTIESGYASVDYDITLAQNRFAWYDEEEMKDPMIVQDGVIHAGVDLFNTVNGDIYGEFKKAQKGVTVTKFDFDAFADADAELNLEDIEGIEKFAFVSPKTMAGIRKECKNTLQYVEAFARNGYVGTLAGYNLYIKKDAVDDFVVCGTREAVTIFNKNGVEVEQERDQNTRKNTVYSRKYYVAAITDLRKCVAIGKVPGTEATITTYTAAGTTVAGAALTGSTVYVYVNGKLQGSATAASNTYTYTVGTALASGDVVKVIAIDGKHAPSTATQTVGE